MLCKKILYNAVVTIIKRMTYHRALYIYIYTISYYIDCKDQVYLFRLPHNNACLHIIV